MNAVRLALAAVLLNRPASTLADWSELGKFETLAELSVSEHELLLNFRFSEAGLAHWQNAPDAGGAGPIANRLLRITDQRGVALLREAKTVETKSCDASAKASPCTEVTLTAALSSLPEQLTITGPSTAVDRDVGLIVIDRGVPLADPNALTKPLTLRLQPQNPWESSFADPNWRRRHTEPRSYIYVEGSQVRHEMLIRLSELVHDLDLEPLPTDRLSVNDRALIKEKVGRFLATRNALSVDGTNPDPQLVSVEFVKYSRSGVALAPDEDVLLTNGALLGAMFTYRLAAPARHIGLRWELFSTQRPMHSVHLIRGAETFEDRVTAAAPTFEWDLSESLDLPPGNSTALAPRGSTPNRAIVEALLRNTYKAFEEVGEEAGYDRLALSLEGDILTDLYLQHRRALLTRDRLRSGEGQVEAVEVLELRPVNEPDSDSTAFMARWLTRGSISHWGHSHTRENAYRARLVLRQNASGNWRINHMDLFGDEIMRRIGTS